jgi:hypothetical protein
MSERFTARTRDLSVGGVGLILDRPLQEGAIVGLSLFLVVDQIEDENTPPLAARGRVVWCAESENGDVAAGIRFEGLEPQQAERLAHFLEEAT